MHSSSWCRTSHQRVLRTITASTHLLRLFQVISAIANTRKWDSFEPRLVWILAVSQLWQTLCPAYLSASVLLPSTPSSIDVYPIASFLHWSAGNVSGLREGNRVCRHIGMWWLGAQWASCDRRNNHKVSFLWCTSERWKASWSWRKLWSCRINPGITHFQAYH